MRLIDADALIKEIKTDIEDVGLQERKIFYRINDAPTIDAVEVVRCKDCKYWQDNNGGYPNQNCRWNEQETPDADDFCSAGERREP